VSSARTTTHIVAFTALASSRTPQRRDSLLMCPDLFNQESRPVDHRAVTGPPAAARRPSAFPATDLRRFFRENQAYKGFRCPFRAVEGGWEPDFSNRYFTEDIPYGLCVYKGLAELAGVSVPAIDEILIWAQTHMGKEYIQDHSVDARDLRETGCPQRYGILSVATLKDVYE